MNINPQLWGNSGWEFMHWITLGYSSNPSYKEKTEMKNFFNTIGNILPCNSCRINFKKHLIKYPLNEKVLLNRTNLVTWLMNIHNEVNILNGKEIYNLSMLYDKYLYGKQNINIFYIILFILFILLLVILFMRYKKLHNRI